MKRNNIKILRPSIYSIFPLTVLVFTILFGCNKSFLAKKPNKSLVIPTSLKDFQPILDNYQVMSTSGAEAGEIASDNAYTDFNTWNTLQPTMRNCYIWGTDVFNDNSYNGYSRMYEAILYANVVLDGLAKISVSTVNRSEYNFLKGQALFFRSFYFFNVARLFCKAYDSTTANFDSGIILRLNSDLNQKSVRSTVKDTYSKIIEDCKTAAYLLPETVNYKTRPSKPAVYGLLSRIYLSMSDYIDAEKYADSCLRFKDELLDYNTLDFSISNPIPKFNQEVIFHSTASTGYFFSPGYGSIDSTLINSYNENDLRKIAFFRELSNGNAAFFGSYDGTSSLFNGIATDEIILIYAECQARKGNINKAMSLLNKLIKSRWKENTFNPFEANDESDALRIILRERRKELVCRCIRWSDLRRLNREPAFGKTITRNLNEVIYTLKPNDKRYVFKFPEDVIQLSGIQQNP